MPVDVSTEIEIDRPRAEVAAFAADPDNATAWYRNIEAVEWETPRPVAVGLARGVRRALPRAPAGLHLRAHRAGADDRLVMRTAQGPFPMETTYAWRETGPARTHMTLRNTGAPSGFPRLFAPLMAPAMRRANTKDLRQLKTLLEGRHA